MLTLSLGRLMRSSRWLSLAMLLALHLALWLGSQSMWERPLVLMHLGLFLLWHCAGIVRDRGRAGARRIVLASVIYLPALLLLMALDKIR